MRAALEYVRTQNPGYFPPWPRDSGAAAAGMGDDAEEINAGEGEDDAGAGDAVLERERMIGRGKPRMGRRRMAMSRTSVEAVREFRKRTWMSGNGA